jgi:hypothetical protein
MHSRKLHIDLKQPTRWSSFAGKFVCCFETPEIRIDLGSKLGNPMSDFAYESNNTLPKEAGRQF